MDLRLRVLLEPRGFIRVLEWLLAIVAFATTGGYSGTGTGAVTCGSLAAKTFNLKVSYPFNLESTTTMVPNCTNNKTWGSDIPVKMMGDFSPTSQWFVFVGVMAFLVCMAAVVFYVAFESLYRQTHERIVTIGDFAVTIIFAFLWITAAGSWAWGIGQVKAWGSVSTLLKSDTLKGTCGSLEHSTCTATSEPDYSPLNASVAFAFLSFFVWVGNCWFVYKETPYHEDQKDLGVGGPNQQVPSNQM